MRVYAEFELNDQKKVERLHELDFIPRVGETIGLANLQGGHLVVKDVHHAFGPKNNEQIIRLISDYIAE